MNPFQNFLLKKIKTKLPGYRQDRYRFYEDHAEFTKVIEVQFINIGNDKKAFTIHFGVYVPILYEILWSKSKPKSIEAGECVFFCNINSIATGFKGKPFVKYWDLENFESLHGEIEHLVENCLFPFSQQINSLGELNSLIDSTDYPGKYVATRPILNAALKYLLGKNDQAEKLVNELGEKNPDYYNPQIKEMNKKFAAWRHKVK
jgi:hypothetical protein